MPLGLTGGGGGHVDLGAGRTLLKASSFAVAAVVHVMLTMAVLYFSFGLNFQDGQKVVQQWLNL